MPVVHGPQRLRVSNSNKVWDAFDPDELGGGLKTVVFVLPVASEGPCAPLILFPHAGAIRRSSALIGVPGTEVLIRLEKSTMPRIDSGDPWSSLCTLTLPADSRCVTELLDGLELNVDDCLRLHVVGASDARNITVSVDIEVI